jgi:hypothetical protein
MVLVILSWNENPNSLEQTAESFCPWQYVKFHHAFQFSSSKVRVCVTFYYSTTFLLPEPGLSSMRLLFVCCGSEWINEVLLLKSLLHSRNSTFVYFGAHKIWSRLDLMMMMCVIQFGWHNSFELFPYSMYSISPYTFHRDFLFKQNAETRILAVLW